MYYHANHLQVCNSKAPTYFEIYLHFLHTFSSHIFVSVTQTCQLLAFQVNNFAVSLKNFKGVMQDSVIIYHVFLESKIMWMNTLVFFYDFLSQKLLHFLDYNLTNTQHTTPLKFLSPTVLTHFVCKDRIITHKLLYHSVFLLFKMDISHLYSAFKHLGLFFTSL